MNDCRTCRYLGLPLNARAYAEDYRRCGWKPAAVPSNVLHLHAMPLMADGPYETSRWITVGVLENMPELLKKCPTWEAKP